VKAMRVKYEVYRDGDLLVAAAIVKFNRKEEKRLAELLKTEGEITLCFLTTLTEVENPLIISRNLTRLNLIALMRNGSCIATYWAWLKRKSLTCVICLSWVSRQQSKRG
jgi:hypothetical protein